MMRFNMVCRDLDFVTSRTNAHLQSLVHEKVQ